MLPSILTAGRPKFLVMRRTKLRYRSTRLVSFSLGSKLDEDDDTEIGISQRSQTRVENRVNAVNTCCGRSTSRR